MCWEEGLSFMAEMGGCCGCFGFLRKPHKTIVSSSSAGDGGAGDIYSRRFSQECLLPDDMIDDAQNFFYTALDGPNAYHQSSLQVHPGRSEDIFVSRIKIGLVCRQIPVRETRHVVRSEDEIGNKMINEYVREGRIGSGSYGKVVLYRSTRDGKQYAMKIFHKSHLVKLRVAPSETAMSDVLREVSIMKVLEHPNIVNLIEVIDDPNTDHFYMVLEYVQGKWVCEGSGPPGGLGESISRQYMRGIIAGLMYLHSHNIVHGDIKPDNLLVTSDGTVKIGDFSVSQVFEEDNDELRRSPGTPVFTAPECCLGLAYHGRAADTWAVGVTLSCMIFGKYPFLGETLQDTYDKIVNDPLCIPSDVNPLLRNLLEGLLCKDPRKRTTLDAAAEHPWVLGEDGPIPKYVCWCKRKDRGTELR